VDSSEPRDRRSHRAFRADAIAGSTTAAVVVPQAMAYAAIAGLAVQLGLYAGLVPMAVYAALGTSRTLSVSTTSTVAALTATALVAAGASTDPSADWTNQPIPGSSVLATGADLHEQLRRRDVALGIAGGHPPTVPHDLVVTLIRMG
jgi:MFS superfamily sulfate permease-like transporter